MQRLISAAIASAIVWFSTPSSAALAQTMLHVGSATVQKTGSGSSAVILIPGLGGGSYVWDGIAPQLARRMTVYTVTFDGFDGMPPGNAPYLDAFTRSIALLIEREQLVKPLLIGHSLGGHVAVHLAETMPAALGAVMAVDALPLFPPPQAGETAASRKASAAAMQAALLGAPDAAYAAQTRAATGYLVSDARDVESVTRHTLASDRKTLAGAVAEMMLEDLTPGLAAIRVPVTVLVPAATAATADASAAYYRALYAGVPQLTVVPVAPSKHFVMLDQPAAFHSAVDAFLMRAGRPD